MEISSSIELVPVMVWCRRYALRIRLLLWLMLLSRATLLHKDLEFEAIAELDQSLLA